MAYIDQHINSLGLLVWYTVDSGTIVYHEAFMKEAKKRKLEVMNAKPASKANLFRRACSALELDNEGLIKEPDRRNKIRRSIGNQYGTFFTLTFDKKQKTWSCSDVTSDLAQEVTRKIFDYIDTHENIISNDMVRQILSDFIENKVHGIKTKKSSIYFVEKQYCDRLEKLAEVTRCFPGIDIFIVPLMNDEVQKARLAEAISIEFNKEANIFYEKYSAVLSKPMNTVLAKEVEELDLLDRNLKDLVDKCAMYGNLGSTRMIQLNRNDIHSDYMGLLKRLESNV